MRRLKCFGLVSILLVAVSVLYSVLWSQNVNAAIIDVTNADVVYSGAVKIETCIQRNCTDSQYNAGTWNYVLHQADLYSIRTERDFELKKGDIVEWYLVVRGRLDPSTFAEHYVVTYPGYLGNNYTATVSWETVIDSSFVANANLQPYTVGSGSSAQTYYSFTEEGYLYQIVRFTQVITNDSDSNRKAYIGNSTSQIMTINVYPTTFNDAYTQGINLSVGSLTVYRPSRAAEEMNEKDEEDRNNIESQSSSTQSDSNQAESDMAQGTSSLIGAISSFSSAMAGVHTTNCKLPEISAYNFSLGQLDICTYSPPNWIQTITSVLVSLITIKLAYRIFKRIMNIAKGLSG